jgi:hypothetical protein
MTHTPTPWRTAGSVIMAGDNGYAIADIDGDNGESVIDAAHIVKCVNAHDELVAALDNALGIIHANSTQDCPLTNYPSYREGRAILAKV